MLFSLTGLLFLTLTITSTLALPTLDANQSHQRRQSGGCPSLQLVFARGTTESQASLGWVGGPLFNSLKQLVPGTQAYNVEYSSSVEYMLSPQQGGQTSSKYIISKAQQCPNTKFVVAGYSKGAMVVHDTNLPADVKAKVVGALVFGDPYRTQAIKQWPVADQSLVKSFCAMGDPICQNGANMMAHMSYPGGDTNTAAQFVAQNYQKSGGSSGDTAKTGTNSPASVGTGGTPDTSGGGTSGSGGGVSGRSGGGLGGGGITSISGGLGGGGGIPNMGGSISGLGGGGMPSISGGLGGGGGITSLGDAFKGLGGGGMPSFGDAFKGLGGGGMPSFGGGMSGLGGGIPGLKRFEHVKRKKRTN